MDDARPSPTPSAVLTIFAIGAPIAFFALIAAAVLFQALIGRTGFLAVTQMFQEGGWPAWPIVLLVVPGFAATSVLGALAVRGRRIPAAAFLAMPVFLLALAWAGARLDMSRVHAALGMVDRSDVAPFLLAKGIAETLSLHVFALAGAAPMIACAALCLGLSGVAPLAGRPHFPAAVASGGIIVVAIGSGAVLRLGIGLLPAALALAGALGIAVAAAGLGRTGSNDPASRSAAIAALGAATLAGALGTFLAAWLDQTIVVRNTFGVLGLASPEARMTLLGRGLGAARAALVGGVFGTGVVLAGGSIAIACGWNAIAGGVRRRGVRMLAVVALAFLPIAALASERAAFYREMRQAFRSRVSFDRTDVLLPSGRGRSATSRYPDAPVVSIGRTRLDVAGRPVGSVSLLDSPAGRSRLAEALAAALPPPRPPARPLDLQLPSGARIEQAPDRAILVAADRASPASRLVAVLEALPAGGPIAVGVLCESGPSSGSRPFSGPFGEGVSTPGAVWLAPPPADAPLEPRIVLHEEGESVRAEVDDGTGRLVEARDLPRGGSLGEAVRALVESRGATRVLVVPGEASTVSSILALADLRGPDVWVVRRVSRAEQR